MDDPGASGVALPALIERELPKATPAASAATGSPILTGHVGRALLWLALPVLGEQVLNMCVLLTDMFLAGFIGSEATVAVGLAAHLAWLVGIIFGLVGTAATAMVARAIGQRRPDEANQFANQAVALAIGMGVTASITVISVAAFVPRLFGLHSAAAALATHFIRIDGLGQVLWGAMFVGNACMRGAGDTRTPLRLMAIVNLCNMSVSAVLSLGVPGLVPRLGVSGIAAGTAIAQTIGGVLAIATLAQGRSGRASVAVITGAAALKLRLAQMRPCPATLWRLLRIGVPAGLDGITIWLGQLLFVRIINGLGTGDLQTDIYAAHIIGIRIESLSYLSAYAWATAAATMVGQSLGARDPDRAERSGQIAARQATAIAAFLTLFYLVFAPQLYGLFAGQQRVIDIGVPALRWLAFFQIPCALMIVYPGALRGAGDTRFPLVFAVVGMALVRLPLAYLGGHVLRWGLPGAWIGMFGDMTMRASLGAWRFRQGGWKKVRV
jgi:MATE family multidrug resistance protein